MTNNSVKGLWKETLALEKAAECRLRVMLEPYEAVTEILYECGVEVATLKSKRGANTGEDLLVAALFVKRCLNDFRTVWILLNLGYTSQAGAIAAAMFEHALMISAVVGRIDRVEKVMRSRNTESPWGAKKLCRIEVEAIENEGKIIGLVMSEDDKEKQFRTIYSLYEWLCKIKHPTMVSAQHDADSTALRGNYVVMAAPDIGILDLPIKYNIISITIGRLHCAIRRFALGMELDHLNTRVQDWLKRFNTVIPGSVDAYRSIDNIQLPVQVKQN